MELLLEAIIYLVAAIVAVPISKRLGFGSVLGYLSAGILIGPFGFALIQNSEHMMHFAELGVVFLLFIIGLELQPSRLWVLRRMVFGLGSAQFILSTAIIASIAAMFGLTPVQAIVTGAILALSSTAFVLQMLAEKQQLSSSHGRAAFTILLFQDLAAIPLIALVPILGHTSGSSISFGAVALVIATLIGLVVGGRYLLRPVMRVVAKTGIPELFTATALLVVIGAAVLMQMANTSMVLGAFIAGMLLADSEYRHELEADIGPFKGLLLGLFFIAVGMNVNLELLGQKPLSILLLVVLLMGAKAIVLLVVPRFFGLRNTNTNARLAAVLCQGGEFAFVLFALVAREQLLEQVLVDQLILAVAVSMMLTPIIYFITERVGDRAKSVAKPEYDEMSEQHHAVMIAGFGRVGQIVGRLLRIAKRPYTALEIDSTQVDVVRRYGTTVYYGDASKPELLRAAGIEHVKVFVLAIGNIETSLRIAETVTRLFPEVNIVARARNRLHEYKLMDLGIEHIYRETFLSSVVLGEQVLKNVGTDPIDARHIADVFKKHDRQLILEQHAIHHDEQKLIQSAEETARELDSLLQRDLDQE